MTINDDEPLGPLLTEWEYQRRDTRNAFRDAMIETVTPWMEWLNDTARRLTNT